MKNPLAYTPWWTTPLGSIIAMWIAWDLAGEFPATMLAIAIVAFVGLAVGVAVLLFTLNAK